MASLRDTLANLVEQYKASDTPLANLMRGDKEGAKQSVANALQQATQDPYSGLNVLGTTKVIASSPKAIAKALNAKVISDEFGKPLTLYHGGPKFEGQFKIPEGIDKGIYFTDNPYLAQDQFALQHELAMRDKTGFGYKDVPEHMLESGEWDPKYFKFAEVKKVNLHANNPKIIEALDAKVIPKTYSPEHDAIIVKSTGDFGYKGGQYVVFDPNQINILK